jgi:hypothetical protein
VAIYARAGALYQVLAAHKAKDGTWCRWQQPQPLKQSNQQEGKR